MSVTPGFLVFKLAYQVTPIILTGGIAQSMGGAIPIILLTEGLNFLTSVLSGGVNVELDGFFANYQVIPGGQMISTQPAVYPSATQIQAANAQVQQPKSVSVRMLCPASGPNGGFLLKFAIMQSLQATLEQHNNSGGTYIIVTPSFIYQNCLMTRMTDISAGETTQVQYAWQFDFFQPQLSEQQISNSLGNLLSSFTNGTQPGAPNGLSLNMGGMGVANPTSFLQSGIPVGNPSPGFS